MTSPNIGSTGDVPDAANAQGINALSNQAPAATLQGQMNQTVGPLGAVASGLMGGIAGGLISKANASAANGTPSAMYNAANFVSVDANTAKENSKDPVLETIVTITTQVTNVQQVLSAPTGVGLWETGPDPTGIVSFPFSGLASAAGTITGTSHTHGDTFSTDIQTAHTHSYGSSNTTGSAGSHSHTVNGSVSAAASGGTFEGSLESVSCTASYAPWAAIRSRGAAERSVITFVAKATGTVTTFKADVYLMDDDGGVGHVVSTVDSYAADLTSNWKYIQMTVPTPVPVEEGDVVWVQWRMTGAGSVQIAAVNLPVPGYLDGFYPRALAAGRNPTTPTPSSLDAATFNGLYQGMTAWVSFGIDVGQTDIPRFFYDDFNRSAIGSQWMTAGTSSVRPRIKDGYVELQTDFLGTTRRGLAMPVQSMRSDVMSVEADITNTSGREAGLGVCLNSSGSGVWLLIRSTWSAIATGGYSGFTTVAEAAGEGGAGHWKLALDPDLGVWTATRNGEDIGLSWAEALVPHGRAYRRGGLSVLSTSSSSARIDNFILQDIVAEDE